MLYSMILILAAFVSVVVAQERPPQPSDDLNSPSTDSFTEVMLGNESLAIYGGTRNTGRKPGEQRFFYVPAFAPKTDEAGKILVAKPVALPNGNWQIEVELILGNKELRELALQAVRKAKPDIAAQIEDNNVAVWPVKWLELTLPADTKNRFPTATLARNTWNIDSRNSIQIAFVLPSEEDAKRLAEGIANVRLDIRYAKSASNTIEQGVEIASQDLQTSTLFVDLKGDGSGELFIRRCDLRAITDAASRILDIRRRIEDPARFDDTFLDKLLKLMEAQLNAFDAELKEFDKIKWERTYNADDLKPTILNDYFNKVYTYDETEKKYKMKSDVDTKAKASLAKIFGGEGQLKASFEKEDFERFVATRDIIVHATGSIIVPKSLRLLHLNTSKLTQTFTLRWTDYFVDTPRNVYSRGTVEFGPMAKESSQIFVRQRLKVASERAAALAAEGAQLKTVVEQPELNRFNKTGQEKRRLGLDKLREAERIIDTADAYVRGNQFDKAIAEYIRSHDPLLAAVQAYKEALDNKKADGFITGYDYTINIGPKVGNERHDKEKASHAVIRISYTENGQARNDQLNLGGRTQWDLGRVENGSRRNLNIPIQSDANLYVGFGDEPGDRNCVTTADFSITVHFRDVSGLSWTETYRQPARKFSTDDKGGNAEDVSHIGTINRYSSFEN